jgi:hypothetical protein
MYERLLKHFPERNRECEDLTLGMADIPGTHGVSAPVSPLRDAWNTARDIQIHSKRSNFITGSHAAFINDIKMAVKIILAVDKRVRNRALLVLSKIE